MLKNKWIPVMLCFLLVPALALAQKKPKDTFQFPALNKISMPDVKTMPLKNGMRLYLVEDPQYPTIDLRAMIRTGSIYEPADKIGLASLTGTVMRTGGTQTRTGDELDQLLESLGASVETGIGQDAGYASLSVLKEDVDKGIEILADLLMHPAFRQEKIDLAKIEMKSVISRRNDNVDAITSREFNNLIYGKDHPYSRYAEYSTVEAIKRDDLVAFHKQYFHPNNILLAVWGDFKAADMKKKIETVFAAWPAQTVAFPAKPRVEYTYQSSIHFIPKNDVNQSRIQLGHIGGMLNDPDYPALSVMNQILAMDRMFKVLRSQEGLTYSPFGYFGANYDYPGVFACGTQTKSQSTAYALRLILREVKRMTEEAVTDEELSKAKESYLNSYVFNFDSKAKIVNRMMYFVYYGYPLDFIDRVKQGVEKVTKEDVLRVAKKNLHPDQVQILVVGKKEDFDEPLSVFGSVNEIDITIPTPQGEAAPKATDATLQKGRASLDKMVQALGGLEAFSKIKNVYAKMDASQTTPMGEMNLSLEATIVYPDRMHQTITMPMGVITMVVTKEDGWIKSPQGTMPLQEAMRKPYQESLQRDPVFFVNHLAEAKVQWLGEKKFADHNAIDLAIAISGNSFHLYLDPSTSLPLGTSYQTIGQQGPVAAEEYWSDFRDLNGIKIAGTTISRADGKQSGKVIIKEITANGPVDEKLFQK
jgi:predicted Zn-dependent peptidase